MAVYLGRLANEIGGGRPLMQRVGDFRMGKRSTAETFNEDLYAFPPSCPVTAGDLGLAVPAKIMRHIWAAMKKLDTIVPGVLHPSTIMYYPEIKMYANKPAFLDRHFVITSYSIHYTKLYEARARGSSRDCRCRSAGWRADRRPDSRAAGKARYVQFPLP